MRATASIFALLPVIGLFIGVVGCDKRVHCTGWSGSDGQLLSVGSLTGCSDGKSRDVRCARGENAGPYACTCVEGGTQQKTFKRETTLPSSAENLSRLGAEECGWPLK